jgi:hypothetical protein
MPKTKTTKRGVRPHKKNVVVVKKVRLTTPKPKKASIPRSLGQPKALSQYGFALADPFNDKAIGARVPDMFSAPTVTYRARGTMTIGSNASGVASLLLNAAPHISTIDMTGSSVTTSGQQNYPTTNAGVYQSATISNLYGDFSTYRVVGAGWKIRNLLPPTSATGRIIIAPAASVGVVPGPGYLTLYSSTNEILARDLVGIDTGSTTSGFLSDILEFPDSVEYTIQDIISNSISLNSKPLSPQAFNFANTNLNINNTGPSETGDVFYTTSSGLVAGGENANDRIYGWESFMLRAEGLPVSTAACFEVQYVVHLEGIPPSLVGAGQLCPAIVPVSHVDINGHNTVLSKVLSSPSIRFATDLASSGFNGYKKGGAAGAGIGVLATLFSKLGMQF